MLMRSVSKTILYGVPGVGKSTIAKALASHTNTEYVELDAVRPAAQKQAPRSAEPFVYAFTTDAWQHFGDFSRENVTAGFQAVRQAMEKYVYAKLADKQSYVAEAAFINPHALTPDAMLYLITVPDAEQHYSQFFVHRPRSREEDLQFEAARFMQDFLIGEAERLGVQQIANSGNPRDVIKFFKS